jgi:hypothetical protein
MVKSILAITILALSTSAALAAHRTHHHYRNAMNAYTGAAPSPVVPMGGVSSSDRAMYIRNLHDSGYNPKNDFTAGGTLKTQ